jgi:thiol-disulfide isomerase/thioredoxin
MKKLLLLLTLFVGFASSAIAKDGYKITLKFNDKNLKDSIVYLAHYYGKPLPSLYKADSARFDKNNVAVIESKEKIEGGIYIILLGDHSTFFEFLLDNGDDIGITATSTALPDGLQFKGSPENERFVAYERFLKKFGEGQQKLQEEIKAAKTKADTEAVRLKSIQANKDLMKYRGDYIEKYPNAMLSNVFNAIVVPIVPEGKHLLPNGKEDSAFAYHYYKTHFWDKFNFKDNRLIHTPLYDAKLEEYFNKLVLPYVDSQKVEADTILARTRGQQDLFKYSLWWLTKNAENSKIMGMDELFVYLVEKYYMKGDAFWLSNEDLQKYVDRVQKIAPNVIGNVAPEIVMQDFSGKVIPLSSIKSKYTLLVFWTPTCGHCQEEIPKLDSAYRASLKARGVKIYAVRTEDDPQQWQDFIKKHNLQEWTHVYDPERRSDYRSKYDVYSTPVIYLLDEKKKIQGKRIDHSNIGQVIDMIERKEKQAKGS